jgi:type I restriction enzyme S subunit
MNDGWQEKKLGEVCSFLNRGLSPKYIDDGGIVVLNQRCVRDHRVDYAVARRHDAASKPVSSQRLLRAGDVLVNSIGVGTLGRVAQLRDDPPGPSTVDSHVTIVRPISGTFFPDFFGYMLREIEEELQGSGEGCGGQTELNRTVLAEKFLVRFPKSIPEQQRIVGILDEAFEGISAAKSNAEKNLQNARGLFESHLQSVFAKPGPSWAEMSLEEVADTDCTLSYGIVQPGEEVSDGLPIVRPTDLTTKEIRLKGLKRIDPKLAESYKRTSLIGSELLLCVRGSTGVISIASAELAGANVTRGIVPIRFKSALLRPDFGFYAMSAGPIQDQIREKTYGAALMQINIRDVKTLRMHYPSLQEQDKLTAKLDRLHEETQLMESIYQQKAHLLEALQKSLLHQAFTGQL